MEKYCQSCGMPLINNQEGDNRGTNKDGSKSPEYCNACYRGGDFVEPDITLEQMEQRGIKGIEDSQENIIKKWLLKKSYPSMLKKLKRWQ